MGDAEEGDALSRPKQIADAISGDMVTTQGLHSSSFLGITLEDPKYKPQERTTMEPMGKVSGLDDRVQVCAHLAPLAERVLRLMCLPVMCR